MPKKKATNEKSAGSPGQETERCHWTSADELCLINYITIHKAKGGDRLNFDKKFWVQVATDVAHTTKSGVVKTPHSCHQKWQRVCASLYSATFYIVDWIANFSGISWSNECGADI
ncbi:hypothetical protein BDR05DRAFT_888308 [Suillus weaverae]|nr:hypothetical protein BDR05DRAFT_888308 [Suillus weaverae]